MGDSKEDSLDIDRDVLSNIDKKLKNIIYQPKFCGLCFEGDSEMCTVVLNMDIVTNGKVSSVPLIKMVHDLFPNISGTPAWPYLCEQCKEQIIQSYIFIQNTKATIAVINAYVNDFNSKVVHLKTQLDPSCDYDNSNVIIVLDKSKDLVDRPIETMVHNTVNKSIEKAKVIPGLLISGDTNGNTVAKIESMPIKVKIIETKAQNNEKVKVIETKAQNNEKVRVIETKEQNNEKVKVIETKAQNNEKVDNNPKKRIKIDYPSTKTSKIGMRKIGNAYECMKCQLRLPTFRSWKDHERKFHKVPVLKCRICSTICDTVSDMNAHYKMHSAVKCKNCHNIMEDTHLADHLKQCHRKTS